MLRFVVLDATRWMVLAMMVFAVRLRGDTIELKTSERIEGRFKQATSTGAVIEVGGQAITIPLEKVRAIYFGAAPKAVEKASLPRDALEALKGLQSVTKSGINYLQYTSRVLDARVKVDQYLSSRGTDSEELRGAIRAAMREYELAASGWNASLGDSILAKVSNMSKIYEEPAVAKCPAIQAARAAKTFLDSQVDILWLCASAQIGEAERLLAKESTF